MAIRNYTSSVPFERSVSAIETKLVSMGARNIGKTFDDNHHLIAVVFDLFDGETIKRIRLPGNAEKVAEVLMAGAKRPRAGFKEKIREQAERTAWKLMLDWVDLQLALIRLNQVEPLEVFMPYIYDGKRTLYEIARDNDFKMLPAPEGR